MNTALKAEEDLREEIDVMREIILKYNKQKVDGQTRSNPTHLAAVEIQGSDLRGLNIGFHDDHHNICDFYILLVISLTRTSLYMLREYDVERQFL
jgi:hypothetical protein